VVLHDAVEKRRILNLGGAAGGEVERLGQLAEARVDELVGERIRIREIAAQDLLDQRLGIDLGIQAEGRQRELEQAVVLHEIVRARNLRDRGTKVADVMLDGSAVLERGLLLVEAGFDELIAERRRDDRRRAQTGQGIDHGSPAPAAISSARSAGSRAENT